MSSVILLSSSPPRIFARSPTQAESPSQPQSSDGKTNRQLCSRTKFKAIKTDRDSFGSAFISARQALATKSGAENSPLSTPSWNRFKLGTQSRCKEDANSLGAVEASPLKDEKSTSGAQATIGESAEHIRIQILPSDVRKKKKTAPAKKLPVSNGAVARRKDWTPPRLNQGLQGVDSTIKSASFPEGLLQGFECNANDAPSARIASAAGNAQTKRRKVEILTPDSSKPPSVQRSVMASNEQAVKKRNKSPTKKSLTITGLATSNYCGINENKNTPMMQYLVSTQAQTCGDDSENNVLQTKVPKKKRNLKKPQQKSLLVSPASAMKTFDDQDVLFASASQLLREESPVLLRDTIETTKLSQENFMSDPILTQQTAVVSVESHTPRVGISRFRGQRNLWGAADRDEDKALLHVDDHFDTPVLTNAFAGKDALVELGRSRLIAPETRNHPVTNSLHLLNEQTLATLDIDDITTPKILRDPQPLPTVQKRFTHGRPDAADFASTSNQAQRGMVDSEKQDSPERNGLLNNSIATRLIPKIPNYAGFTDDELKKQLKDYGFKRMRKRENMIDTLKRCWIEKYGPIEEDQQPETKRHGDFLTKIHHVSDRPQPKVKKPRVRNKKAVDDSAPPTAKKRKDAKATVDEGSEKKAKSRKRKPDSELLPDIPILDVDEVDRSTYFDTVSAASAFIEQECEVPSFTGVGRSKAAKGKSIHKERLPTPPSTIPAIVIPSSSPGFEDLESEPLPPAMPSPMQSFTRDTNDCDTMNSNEESPEIPDIKIQVERAIKYPSIQPRSHETVARNHQRNPTFHEKILMYDPIILEELTAWLNTKGLNAIGEDREVDIMEVKAWCETNGICCLWKGGWRGNGLKGITE